MTGNRQCVLKVATPAVEKIKMNNIEQEPAGPAEPDLAVSRAGRRTGWVAGVPRWVKVFIVTTMTLVLLMVVVMLLVGGQHGPGRHLSSARFDSRSAQVTNTNLLSADGTSAPSGP
jgi:hypothetical protein